MTRKKSLKVLISTLPLSGGGVSTHTNFVLSLLKQRNYKVTIAFYQPYSKSPELSVPFWEIGRKKIKWTKKQNKEMNIYEIGCWFPELEFTHYWPTSFWKKLIEEHDIHIAVSGNTLAAFPFALTSCPFLAWVGTPFLEDRKDRVKQFPFIRRWVDYLFNSRVCSLIEKKILNSGVIIPTTQYVYKELNNLASSDTIKSPIGIPVDLNFFKPRPEKIIKNKIGFAGRYNDPRKNIFLLINAVKHCHYKGVQIFLELVGAEANDKIKNHIENLGLKRFILCSPKVSMQNLLQAYQSFSAFVIPSYQEGLCISGLEAMAAGCPVITTACGGPEVYVKNNFNGFVIGKDPRLLAEKIIHIVTSSKERKRLSCNAQKTVQIEYNQTTISKLFWKEFDSLANSSVK